MKRLVIMIVALALVLGMSQCRKPVETINAEPKGETVDVTVSVTSGADKTKITPTGVVTWKAGDKLYVVGVTDGLLGSVSAIAAGDPMLFSGKIKALTAAQTLKFYYVGDSEFTLDGSGRYTFSIENQDGSLAGIAANNQLMWGKTDDVTPGATDLGTISVTSLIAIAHLDINYDGSAVAGPVTVTDGFKSATFDAKTYDGAALTGGTAGDMTMTFAAGTKSTDCHMALLPGSQTLTFTTSDGKTKTLAAKDVASNTFYNSGEAIAVNLEAGEPPVPAGGVFTVAEGKTVEFSHGNMWADATDPNSPVFHFENSQTAYYTTYDASHVSHFLFQPYSRMSNSSAVSFDATGQSVTDVFFTNATATTANANFCVSGQTPGTWRTLSDEEWNYILYTRSGNRFAYAMVNDIKGLLIFPDGYTGATSGTGMSTVNNGSANYPPSNIPDDVWETMDAGGVIFLPAAERRNEIAFTDDKAGYYWTSVGHKFQSTVAYYMFFDGYSINPANDMLQRRFGKTVRLVRDINPGPVPLGGDFTVGKDGDTPIKVKFSNGNLYYDGSESKWKFESNQWDFRTYEGKNSCINGSVTTDGTPSGDWGLFGWSGSLGSATYGKSTSGNDFDYAGDFNDWGGITDLPDNAGGNTWRTLSYDEWNYLLGYDPMLWGQTATCGRPNAMNLCAWVTLTDVSVSGLVILPDDSSVTASNVTTAALVTSSGAVFLPASGKRDGTNMSNVGSCGYYWSSTSATSSFAYFMGFGVGSVYTDSYVRLVGSSVRLVRSGS